MYDFEGERGYADDPGPSTSAGVPSRALTLLELPRWMGEYGTSRTWDLVNPLRHDGEGRPVLVIPGFAANDVMTGRLRSHLRGHGFAVHSWRQGRNIGLTDALIDGLSARFEQVATDAGEPVSIVGWSFGGMWARWLAHQHPDLVRQVVCLGTPWRADGERTRATAMFERSRRRNGISERAFEIVTQVRRPLPVPCTAIWSRTDGVVPWRGCRVEETTEPVVAENVEVISSHVGLVANPLALSAVVDRLLQDPAEWRPHTWLPHPRLPAQLARRG